jgi:hypothetical protein
MSNDLISRQAAIALAYFHGKTATWDNPTPDGVDAVDGADLEKIPAAQFEKEIAKREPDDDWIKCSEKIPENGKNVLIAIKNNRYSWIDIGYIDGDGYWTVDGEPWDRESDPAITHWMPLPMPPKED